MTQKHTNGPWTVVDGKSAGKAIIAENEPKVRRNVASVGGQNREGNANLIAAAPDMLKALKEVLRLFSYEVEDASDAADFASAVEIQVQEAVAKAEGRS